MLSSGKPIARENQGNMNDRPALIFYANRNCPYAQRSWIALGELQVYFTYKDIELGKDNKTDWFHQLNPNGTVPVIQHGETVVYESLVINEYLQEVFGSDRVKLLPTEPGLRAYARILISRCDAKFVKVCYSYLSHKPDGSDDNAKDDQLRGQLEAELRFLDTAIGKFGGPYFLGESMSLVDIAYIPFFERMQVALTTWKGLDIRRLNLSYLNHWLEVMSNSPSYGETRMTPEKIREVYSRFLGMDYFKKVGIAG